MNGDTFSLFSSIEKSSDMATNNLYLICLYFINRIWAGSKRSQSFPFLFT